MTISWSGKLSLKLDHLIRNVLKPDDHPDVVQFLDARIVCAIKSFLQELDSSLRLMRVDPQHLAMIHQRIEFCREIELASDAERAACNYEPLSADWFESLVKHYGSSMHEVVYLNPFHTLVAGWYAGGTEDKRLRRFHTEMQDFWH